MKKFPQRESEASFFVRRCAPDEIEAMDNLYFGRRGGTSEDDDDDDDDSAKNENDTGRGGRRGSRAESGEHNGRPNLTRDGASGVSLGIVTHTRFIPTEHKTLNAS